MVTTVHYSEKKKKLQKPCMSINRYLANRTLGINEQKCSNLVFITAWRETSKTS